MPDIREPGKDDRGSISFEPSPPSFSELVQSIMRLWNPRTRNFFTEEEARLLAASAQRRRMK